MKQSPKLHINFWIQYKHPVMRCDDVILPRYQFFMPVENEH